MKNRESSSDLERTDATAGDALGLNDPPIIESRNAMRKGKSTIIRGVVRSRSAQPCRRGLNVGQAEMNCK